MAYWSGRENNNIYLAYDITDNGANSVQNLWIWPDSERRLVFRRLENVGNVLSNPVILNDNYIGIIDNQNNQNRLCVIGQVGFEIIQDNNNQQINNQQANNQNGFDIDHDRRTYILNNELQLIHDINNHDLTRFGNIPLQILQFLKGPINLGKQNFYFFYLSRPENQAGRILLSGYNGFLRLRDFNLLYDDNNFTLQDNNLLQDCQIFYCNNTLWLLFRNGNEKNIYYCRLNNNNVNFGVQFEEIQGGQNNQFQLDTDDGNRILLYQAQNQQWNLNENQFVINPVSEQKEDVQNDNAIDNSHDVHVINEKCDKKKNITIKVDSEVKNELKSEVKDGTEKTFEVLIKNTNDSIVNEESLAIENIDEQKPKNDNAIDNSHDVHVINKKCDKKHKSDKKKKGKNKKKNISVIVDSGVKNELKSDVKSEFEKTFEALIKNTNDSVINEQSLATENIDEQNSNIEKENGNSAALIKAINDESDKNDAIDFSGEKIEIEFLNNKESLATENTDDQKSNIQPQNTEMKPVNSACYIEPLPVNNVIHEILYHRSSLEYDNVNNWFRFNFFGKCNLFEFKCNNNNLKFEKIKINNREFDLNSYFTFNNHKYFEYDKKMGILKYKHTFMLTLIIKLLLFLKSREYYWFYNLLKKYCFPEIIFIAKNTTGNLIEIKFLFYYFINFEFYETIRSLKHEKKEKLSELIKLNYFYDNISGLIENITYDHYNLKESLTIVNADNQDSPWEFCCGDCTIKPVKTGAHPLILSDGSKIFKSSVVQIYPFLKELKIVSKEEKFYFGRKYYCNDLFDIIARYSDDSENNITGQINEWNFSGDKNGMTLNEKIFKNVKFTFDKFDNSDKFETSVRLRINYKTESADLDLIITHKKSFLKTLIAITAVFIIAGLLLFTNMTAKSRPGDNNIDDKISAESSVPNYEPAVKTVFENKKIPVLKFNPQSGIINFKKNKRFDFKKVKLNLIDKNLVTELDHNQLKNWSIASGGGNITDDGVFTANNPGRVLISVSYIHPEYGEIMADADFELNIINE